MSISRHELREQTFKMLFGVEFHDGEDKREVLDNYMDITIDRELKPKERQEIIDRVLAVDSKREELDSLINKVAKGWRTSRMGRAELNLIRLALYEMRYDDTVPLKVAINEAVELGKEYGDDDAPSFINGILARLTEVDKEEFSE
ncbi:MAG: transcription antitermination factor NusB [Candidatus Avilachnospira sp.]|jgi:N utilization substance protein B